MKKQLIIGLGTGRCGSVSLYKVLTLQKNAYVKHETEPILTWKFNKIGIDKKLNLFLQRKEKYVGDVASYYLPYVEYIYKKHPSAKFVVLKRPKEGVVKSFTRRTDKENWNHWIDHRGKKWKKAGVWDEAFPKYDVETKSEALEQYWDNYYLESGKLLNKYPANIKIFDIQCLNSSEGVKEILTFCNFSPHYQRIITEIRENRSEDESFIPRYHSWEANKM